jgi:flagellar motor switch protein FliM
MSGKVEMTATPNDDLLVRVGAGATDRLPGLTTIFDDAAVGFEKRLRDFAPDVSVVVDPVQAIRLNDFEERFVSFGKNFAFRELESEFFVSVSVDAVFSNLLLESLLGSGVLEVTTDRSMTRLEDRVVSHGVSMLVGHFAQSFGSFARFDFVRDRVSEDAGFLSLGGKGSVILYVTMTLNVDGYQARLLFALPRAAIDPFKMALSQLPDASGRVADEKWSEKLYNSLVKTEVRADVRIEAKGYTLGDIARLEVGDILRLPLAPTDPIRVVAESRTLFWCTLGQKDGLYTVRLEDFSDDRESRIENMLGI